MARLHVLYTFSSDYRENVISSFMSSTASAIHRLLNHYHRTRGDDQPRQSLTKHIERTIHCSIMMHLLISSSPLFTSDSCGWRTHGSTELAENPIKISCGLCARTLATSRLLPSVSRIGTCRNVLLTLTFDLVRHLSALQ